jgi:hypothetical protein
MMHKPTKTSIEHKTTSTMLEPKEMSTTRLLKPQEMSTTMLEPKATLPLNKFLKITLNRT